ncbi:MAG: hypothetical protein WA667_00355 [Candidatus Nitrosopolaris sp.]
MQEIETNLKSSSFCVNVLSIIILDLISSDPINTEMGHNTIAMEQQDVSPVSKTKGRQILAKYWSDYGQILVR